MFSQVVNMNIPVKRLDSAKDVQSIFSSRLSRPSESSTRPSHIASFDQAFGYYNPTGGWGEASRACKLVLDDILRMGATVQGGKEMVGLVFEQHDEPGSQRFTTTTSQGKRKVKGVRFSDGTTMMADLVVVAAGAWTPALFAQGSMGGLPSAVATG